MFSGFRVFSYGGSSGSQSSGTADTQKVHCRHLFVRWIGTHYSADLLGEFEDALKVATKDATYYGRHESLSDGSCRIAVVLEFAKKVHWNNGRSKLLFGKDAGHDGVSIVVGKCEFGKEVYQVKVETGQCFEELESVSNVVMFGRKPESKSIRKRKKGSDGDEVDVTSDGGSSKKSRKSRAVLGTGTGGGGPGGGTGNGVAAGSTIIGPGNTLRNIRLGFVYVDEIQRLSQDMLNRLDVFLNRELDTVGIYPADFEAYFSRIVEGFEGCGIVGLRNRFVTGTTPLYNTVFEDSSRPRAQRWDSRLNAHVSFPDVESRNWVHSYMCCMTILEVAAYRGIHVRFS